MDYLLKMIQGTEFPEPDVKLPVKVVIRDSVRPVEPGESKKE